MIEETNDIKKNADDNQIQTGIVEYISVSTTSRLTLFNNQSSNKPNETTVVDEEANDTKQKKTDATAIHEVIICPLTKLIFLEPVKLLLEDDDSGPIVERDYAIRLINGQATCPFSRRAITGYLRMREIETLVADYLNNYPEAQSDQYKRQIITNPPTYHALQQAQDPEAGMPIQEALLDREQERHAAANMFSFEQSQAVPFVIVVTLLTTGVNTMGAAILKSTGYDYNLEEMALTSASGGATLYISVAACYLFLACYFPHHLKHIKETILSPNNRLGEMTRISCYNIGFILSGVLGAAMCGFENTTITQDVAAAATGAAIFDCPMAVIGAAQSIYNARR